jgi:crotonobetainyl-CoA:carnitine CoA-transferase CaiB-like acyl-CoA transferase
MRSILQRQKKVRNSEKSIRRSLVKELVSPPLAEVRVVDFGQYVAGPMAATLLADAGAQVVRIEAPGGPFLRDPGNVYLLRDRSEVHTLDLKTDEGRRAALALVSKADILIENFRPGVMARLGLGPADCEAVNPGLVYCSLPAFSEQDERSSLAGWEGVVLADGGAFRLPAEGSMFFSKNTGATPSFPGLPLASCFAAGLAALATTAALIARVRDGGLGQKIEIPLSDALLEASSIVSTSWENRGPPDPIQAFAPGLYRTKDDRVLCCTIVVYRHLVALAHAMGRSDWVESGFIDYDKLRDEPERAAKLKSELIALFATRDAAAWEALLRPAGVPIAMMRTTREWLNDPGALASGCVVEVDDPDLGPARILGRAVEFEPRPIDSSRELPPAPASAPPLAGFKMLDLSRVVAAPTAARLLADLGAEVIKVDTDPNPASRRTANAEPAFHVYVNRGKRGAVLDLKDPADRGAFESLLSSADGLVTNISFGRLAAVGLSEADVRRTNPSLVVGYLNMYGVAGPLADYRGYAEVANAATGVSSLTSGWATAPSGGPTVNQPPWPYTDSMSGILGAFGVVAAVYGRTQGAVTYQVTTSLTRAALLEQTPFAVDAATTDPFRGREVARPGYRRYEAKDDAVFVALHPDDVASALERLGAGGFAATLEAALTRAIAERTAAQCAALLSFGRSSASVIQPLGRTIANDSPWARRGLRLERVSKDFGVVVTHAPVVRMMRTPLQAGATPRAFGDEKADAWSL